MVPGGRQPFFIRPVLYWKAPLASSRTLLPLPIALVLLKKLVTGALSCVLADGVHCGFFGDIVIQRDISTRDVGRYLLWRFMDIDRHWLAEKRAKIEIEHCF